MTEIKDIRGEPALPDEDTKKILDDMGIGKEPKKEEAKAEPKSEGQPEAKPQIEPSKPELEKEVLPERYIPIPKYQRDREKWKTKEDELSAALQEKENRISELQEQIERSKTSQDFRQRMGAFADKHGLDVEAMTELGNEILSEARKYNKDLASKFEKYETEAEESRQNKLFEEEFENTARDFPEIKDYKDKIKFMGFNEDDWIGKGIYEIYFRGIKPNLTEPKKTAEPAKGGTQRGKKIIDLDKAPTTEEIKEMSDKDFEKLSDSLAKRQGSRLTKSNI